MRRFLLLLATASVLTIAAPAGAASYNTGLYAWVIAGKALPGGCSTAPICADGPDALSGKFNLPGSLAVDLAGNIYVPDYGDSLVRRVTPAGQLDSLTVGGTFAPIRALSDLPQAFDGPTAMAVTPDGKTLYVAVDNSGAGTGGQVLRIANGTTSVYAGSGAVCNTANCGDGGPATAGALDDPEGLALDAAGNLYIADAGANANRIRRVGTGGTITTIAGDGGPCSAPDAACGDGSLATAAQLKRPRGVAVSPNGASVYIADTDDNRIRKVAGGTITTIGGTGDSPCLCSDDSDNGPATGPHVAIGFPVDVAVDPAGNVFVAEVDGQRVRKITPGGTITTIAGGGLVPLPGQAVGTLFPRINGIALDGSGGLVVSDGDVNQIFWLVPSQPLGIPGPKGDKGDTGATGATGPAGANGQNGHDGGAGPAGPQGARGDQTPLGGFACRYRRLGIGRNAVNCFVQIFAQDGTVVRVRLQRGTAVLDSDTARARDGVAGLHLGSTTRLRGAFVLRISERTSRGIATTDSVRVVI